MGKLGILLELLRYGITEQKPRINFAQVSEQDIKYVLKVAKLHEILPIIVDAMHKLNISIESEFKAKIVKSLCSSYLYTLLQTQEIEYISKLFKENNIDYILLKGSVIRNYYPESLFRTSSDVDILIRKKDLAKAHELLCKELNYAQNYESEYDINYSSKNKVTVELHYSLVNDGCSRKENNILNKAWDFAILVEENEYKFTDEYFYFYYIMHTLKHFKNAGTGIRHFVDVFIINSKMHINSNLAKSLLEKSDIFDFTKYIEKLTKIWFEDETHNETTLSMQKFILESGVYGTEIKRNEIKRAKKLKTLKTVFRRIWASNEVIYRLYPQSKKRKFLIPFYKIRRIFVKLFSKGLSKSISESNKFYSIDKDKTKEIKKMFKSLKI